MRFWNPSFISSLLGRGRVEGRIEGTNRVFNEVIISFISALVWLGDGSSGTSVQRRQPPSVEPRETDTLSAENHWNLAGLPAYKEVSAIIAIIGRSTPIVFSILSSYFLSGHAMIA